ncbi:bifunctional 23S rRNA (guanine(2069)-N(7))-methyltransferase RlmK/23S rRNA (guanine(2445)-N(2))-methyltransferase RlmL [Alcanivorax sp. 1008]|uniref:bifunctional 23S rRNA (guanine(2069)-N(7))-methyltransferase RlmK/23S rRNA (guanine(2445)-N(2))-methyltransferase RlmL n=1 Tax=Alcanivorax sp. 1008 TaxID=2816853 RepID=UPI001DC0294D|nr:bifunctional 23S rRNA (guanine(2069)-N(7))-methyltransferase RlmK/23S rRNA (guanine(2445)-N(2))-methyltransferase RlmL [Alcanivorax sp. 1008]
MEMVITCMPGLGELLRRELITLGITPGDGSAAALQADMSVEQALTVCLHSRIAERVLVQLASEEVAPQQAPEALAAALTAQQLCNALALNVHADHEAGVRGDARVSASVFARSLAQPLPLSRETRGALCLRLLIGEQRSRLFVDLCGEPLSRRGYRLQGGAAPLRETLAAAMLLAAQWKVDPQTGLWPALVDPFCGSGTLLIEAALIATGRAPGLLRDEFALRYWGDFQPALWQKLRDLAQLAIHSPQELSLKGFDADDSVQRQARANAERAGVASLIHFERRELGQLRKRDFSGDGMLVTNPPWGERLEDKARAGWLMNGLAHLLANEARGWSATVLGSDVEVLDRSGAETVAQWKVLNGAVNGFVRVMRPQRRAPIRPLLAGEPAFEVPPEAQAFANRLRKNGKQLKRWLENELVQCYRLYDRDLPEFNVSVDVYADRVLVQEFAAPKTVDEKAAEQRRMLAVSAVRSVLGAHREQVFLRTRERQKGANQYQKLGQRRNLMVVHEGGARLLVDLRAYLDTGLFLDHRPVRLRIEEEAAGKRFLNLFGYTGAATVHAAVGGARQSVTVDASNNYLQWAGENLALNGFSTLRHRLERADAMAWLGDCREQFDLVFCDPPTFSNSKSRDDFVVQRDHGELIRRIMRRLEPGGVLYFSCNFRRFELDAEIRRWFKVDDISRSSIPPDFQRHQDIHHLFAIRHGEV